MLVINMPKKLKPVKLISERKITPAKKILELKVDEKGSIGEI
jgi:hypothetical protein